MNIQDIKSFTQAIEEAVQKGALQASFEKKPQRGMKRRNKITDADMEGVKQAIEYRQRPVGGSADRAMAADSEGGITDADMEGAKQAIEYRQRPVKVSGSDVESAIAMREEARTKSPLEKAMGTKPASEKGTGAMLSPKPEGDFLAKVDASPKAKVVAEDELVQSFFAKAHGSNFDPNSRVDKAKMQKILGMVNAQPELLSQTPGKFAVKLYTAK